MTKAASRGMQDATTSSVASSTPRFKDKVKALAAEAELAEAQVNLEEQSQDEHSLATALLVSGHPVAFCGEFPIWRMLYWRRPRKCHGRLAGPDARASYATHMRTCWPMQSSTSWC
jgi:hypothetical protein